MTFNVQVLQSHFFVVVGSDLSTVHRSSERYSTKGSDPTRGSVEGRVEGARGWDTDGECSAVLRVMDVNVVPGQARGRSNGQGLRRVDDRTLQILGKAREPLAIALDWTVGTLAEDDACWARARLVGSLDRNVERAGGLDAVPASRNLSIPRDDVCQKVPVTLAAAMRVHVRQWCRMQWRTGDRSEHEQV